MKQILTWTQDDDDEWTAETKVENYRVRDVSYRSNEPDGSKFEAVRNYEWLIDLGTFSSPDAAMDACEQDYIERCTEFLRVAGPGGVVVRVEDVELLLASRDAAVRTEAERMAILGATRRLTAAIDAAKAKGKRNSGAKIGDALIMSPFFSRRRHPASMSDCYIAGMDGGCGDECPVFKAGECHLAHEGGFQK